MFKPKAYARITAILFLVVLLCIQFGHSTTVSVASFGLLLIALKLTLIKFDLISILSFTILSLLSLFSGSILTALNAGNILQELRIAFVGILYIVLLDGKSKINLDHKFFISCSVAVVLVTIATQTYFYSVGIPLVVPSTLFSIDTDGALAYSALQKAYEGGYSLNFRQSATYSEPSYFGMILISLNFLALSVYGKSRSGYLLFLLLLMAALLSGTLYGQAGLILLMLFWGANLRSLTNFRFILFSLFIFTLVTLSFLYIESFSNRFVSLISGSDISAIARIVSPLKLIYFNLTNAPFGIPLSVAQEYYLSARLHGGNDDASLHNALLNLFVTYGVLGFVALSILLKKMRNWNELLFFVTVMIQNGSIFSFDKLFVVVFTILLGRQIIQRPMNNGLRV